ncbi:MAG: hypothetical protein U0228_05165 [Myxococcaceae bacterium]
MNSLSNLIDDPRVRIAGPLFAAVLCIGFLVMGSVAQDSTRHTKTVSVLPDQPLNIPMLGRTETMSGADAILAWKQPAPKPGQPQTVNGAASQVDPKGKGKPGKAKGTLTARR